MIVTGYWTIVLSGRSLPLALVEPIGQIALVIGFMVIVFIAIAFQFLQVHELYGGGGSDTLDPQTNCPSCGARISVDADTCDYCGDPVDR